MMFPKEMKRFRSPQSWIEGQRLGGKRDDEDGERDPGWPRR